MLSGSGRRYSTSKVGVTPACQDGISPCHSGANALYFNLNHLEVAVEELIAVLAVCVTVYAVMRQALTILGSKDFRFSPVLKLPNVEITITAQAPPAPAMAQTELPEIPLRLKGWIAQESSPEMREEQLRTAHHMHREYDDWLKVEAGLIKKYGTVEGWGGDE